MNVNISIAMKNHGGDSPLRPAYRGLSADIQKGEQQSNVTDLSGIDAASFTEKAIQDVIQSAISNSEESHDLTITGAGLTAGAQTYISDKFTSDEKITSITFN